MNELYTVVSVILCLVGIGFANSAYNFIKDKKNKYDMLMKVINSQTDDKPNPVSFVVNKTGMSATLVYEMLGRKYMLTIPYSRREIANMAQLKVELVTLSGSKVDITQQPGIPYMVNAANLGGTEIIATNEEEGKMYKYVNEIPYYCREVL